MHKYSIFRFIRPSRLQLEGEKGAYFSTWLRGLGLSLVSTFIPIYIFRLTGRLETAFLFYAFTHAVNLASLLPGAWLTRKLGVDWGVFLGSGLRALFLLFLALAGQNLNFLPVAAAVWGGAIACYWLPFHYTVVGAEDGDGQFGREASWIKLVNKLATGLAPLIGGFMVALLGFNWVYGVGVFLVFSAGLPPFFDQFKQKGMRLNFKRVVEAVKNRENRRFIWSFFGVGLESMIFGVAWPLFIFLVLNDYRLVGSIQTIAFVGSLLLLWWLGKRVDQQSYGLLKIGAYLSGLVWFFRSLMTSPMVVFFSRFSLLPMFTFSPMVILISNLVYGWGNLLAYTPFDALVYRAVLDKRKLEFLVIREAFIHLGALIGCLVVWQMVRTGLGWGWVFSLGLVGLVIPTVLMKENQ